MLSVVAHHANSSHTLVFICQTLNYRPALIRAAVIDKDYGSSLLARSIGAELFFVSTAVEKAYLNFGKPDQKAIDALTVAEAKRYIEEGHFAPGSMLPKIEASIWFLEAGGKRAIITNPENIARALRGETGTHITP